MRRLRVYVHGAFMAIKMDFSTQYVMCISWVREAVSGHICKRISFPVGWNATGVARPEGESLGLFKPLLTVCPPLDLLLFRAAIPQRVPLLP